MAVIWLSETTVKLADGTPSTPLIETCVVPDKPMPLIVIVVPAVPLVGEKELIAGVAVTVKLVELVPVPCDVVTLIGPVLTPVGTLAVICVSEFTVKLAPPTLTPLNATIDVPVKWLPVIVTVVYCGPLVGLKELIVGAPVVTTEKELPPLQPTPKAVVAQMTPVVAPWGTLVLICVSETTVKFAGTSLNAVPWKATRVVPVKPTPIRVTEVPTGPLVGEMEAI
jgi:hypothetical protein